jgi:hypothetical protein
MTLPFGMEWVIAEGKRLSTSRLRVQVIVYHLVRKRVIAMCALVVMHASCSIRRLDFRLATPKLELRNRLFVEKILYFVETLNSSL